MKTKLYFNRMLIVLVFMAGIFISSCTKEELILAPEPDLTAAASLKSAQLNDMVCDLIGGQTIPVGSVVYSLQDVGGVPSIVVTYTTSGDWGLYELHLYVGNLAGLPTKNSALQIGHFPYAVENLNGVNTYTFTIPVEGLLKDGGGYTIAAHAVVKNGTQEETAWANCSYQPIITLKSFFVTEPNMPLRYAVTDGLRLNTNEWYCDDLGLNVYQNGDEYMLHQHDWYPISSGGAGKVTVTDDGTNITVTVIPNTGLILDRTYLFVGTMAQFKLIPSPYTICPNYTLFPYQIMVDNPVHVFTIPIPANSSNSISFESIHEKMRWGWYSVVNF